MTTEERILSALRSGPLYRPLLELVTDCTERETRAALQRLLADRRVEIAYDIGPATYRLAA